MQTIKKIFLLSIFTTLYSFYSNAQCPASASFTNNGLTVNFYNTSYKFNSSSWDFGDGNTSSATNPIHTYASPGNYYVTLQISYTSQTLYGPFTNWCTIGGNITVTNPYIYGCIDPAAINFNPSANIDDGSCIYPVSCGVITGINLTDIIHDRATFNWDNMNSSSCDVDQIRIRYRKIGDTTYFNKTMGAPIGNASTCLNTSKRILNLLPSTQYEYDFKIWYQDGTINDWHSAGTFTTLPTCNNVTNITAIPLSSTATEFCWDTPSSPWSFVRLKYRIDSAGTSFSNIGGFGVMSPELCKIKNGLTLGTNYRVMWRTWCDIAGGPYRSPVWDGPVTWTQTSSSRLEGENNSIATLEIYPNPSRDVFNISFISETIQDLQVKVLNVVGEEIVVENMQQFVGEYTKKINLQGNSKGIYFLEIKTNNNLINKKLILQ